MVIALFFNAKFDATQSPISIKGQSFILYNRISSIVLLYSGALAFNAFYIQSIGSGIGIYSGLFQVTVISQFLEFFLLLIGSLIMVSWPLFSYHLPLSSSAEGVSAGNRNIGFNNIKFNFSHLPEYSLIILFSTLGATLLVSSFDLISMYLSIELQSFGVYLLASIYRDSDSATSAGLKYFLLGGLSSCIILLGSAILYSYSGLTNFESLYSFASVSYTSDIFQGLSLGFLLIIVGLLFKIAAAPLHNWAPDVYDGSPTIVTIWLTIMPKISIIMLLLELNTQLGLINIDSLNPLISSNISLPFYNGETVNILQTLLLISSLLSLILGTVVGLAQTKIKRLLAYSTISHIGFILLALAISTEQSIEALIFYIIQYSITNLNTFLILIALSYIIYNSLNKTSSQKEVVLNNETNTDINYISQLKGQMFENPLLSLSLCICLFSMAGIPPLVGFFSKLFVLYSAIQSGYFFMAIVAILVSIISASYYLKIVKVLNTANSNEDLLSNTEEAKESNNNLLLLSSYHSFLISSLTLVILFFVLKPSLILSSMRILSISIFYC